MPAKTLDSSSWLNACLCPDHEVCVNGGRYSVRSQSIIDRSHRNVVYFIEQGKLAVQSAGSKHVVEPGDVLWCQPVVDRRFWSQSQDGGETVLTEIRISVRAGENRFTPIDGCRVFRGRRDLAPAFAQLRLLVSDWSENREALLRGAITLLSGELLVHHLEETPEGLSHVQKLKVLKRLDDFVSGSVAVADLADAAGVSQGRFRRKFKHTFGMSARQYQVSRRLATAEELLRMTTLSIKEVCHSVGMKDHNLFSRLFRKYHGMSPSQFRKVKSPIPRGTP